VCFIIGVKVEQFLARNVSCLRQYPKFIQPCAQRNEFCFHGTQTCRHLGDSGYGTICITHFVSWSRFCRSPVF